MKKLLVLIAIISLNATNVMMPPSIPDIKLPTHTKHKTKKPIDKCKLIPPMLINIPPMLEDDLDSCKNKLYLPNKKTATQKLHKLLKTKIIIKNIKSTEGFSMLYQIITNKGTFYCNRNIDRCILAKKIIKGK